MGEFDLIRRIREAAPAACEGVSLGIGDDAAILQLPVGHELVTSCDTLVEGVHFPASCDPVALGHKALAVNLSDLAAMGARPRWALLSLTMPAGDEAWLAKFMTGFSALADRHGVGLVGGDLCSGPLSMSVTLLGQVPEGRGLLRSGLRPGDLIAVSGELGDAALALRCTRESSPCPETALARLHRPDPRVTLGMALDGIVRSCIDVSDGLAQDLGHLAQASACAVRVDADKLPASEHLEALDEVQRWNLQLTGGDDYELCFSLAPDQVGLLDEWRCRFEIRLTIIGEALVGEGVEFLTPKGTVFVPECYGYDHFESAN